MSEQWVRLTPKDYPRNIGVIECKQVNSRLYLRAGESTSKGGFWNDFPPLYPNELRAIPQVQALLQAARLQICVEENREWVRFANRANLAAAAAGNPKPYDYAAIVKRHMWLCSAAYLRLRLAVAALTDWPDDLA